MSFKTPTSEKVTESYNLYEKVCNCIKKCEPVAWMNHCLKSGIGYLVYTKPPPLEGYKPIPPYTTPQTKPSDVEYEQLIKQRDSYHEWADRLASAIGAHFDYEIGDHSSANCPWTNAMVCIESPQPEPQTKPLSWINVNERLPNDGEIVAFVVKSSINGYLDGRVLGGIYRSGVSGGFSVPDMTTLAYFWMPLPKAPLAIEKWNK